MTTYRIRIFAARPVDRERPYPGVGSASPREVYHRLLARGEDWRTAATLTGWVFGLRCFEGEEIAWTWSIEQVEHLIFLRALSQQGRIGGMADGEVRVRTRYAIVHRARKGESGHLEIDCLIAEAEAPLTVLTASEAAEVDPDALCARCWPRDAA